MKTENELNIFTTPNLDMLKSMYSKSKAYVTDKISQEYEATLIADVFRQFKDSGKVTIAQRDFGAELKIFNATSIEVLKSLYYHSIGPVFNIQSWELEVTNLKQTFWQYDNLRYAKKSVIHIGRELKIFNKPSIDALKFLYKSSIGYVLKKESWNFETPLISRTFRILNKNHRTKKMLSKIGDELRIFNNPSIESLKAVYIRTSNYLEGPQQQSEQPSSI